MVNKAFGVTQSERLLQRLCNKSFLSLWSYAGIYRDQGHVTHGKGDGKEVCDLLVVFGNHILIFSDKDCQFSECEDNFVGWCRWYRKAVADSAKQIFGAERWIRDNPSRLFLDRSCSQKFPVPLPPKAKMKIHRVVVAHGASKKCREIYGGSGSLMLNNQLVGDDHCSKEEHDRNLFNLGQVNPQKGFVHVFDDTTLDIVMKTVDTVQDFVWYLEKKEKFLSGETAVFAAGEEELLANYLSDVNSNGEHDFVMSRFGASSFGGICFAEGSWEEFSSSECRANQVNEDRISYAWDTLIEVSSKHILEGTQHFFTNPGVEGSEIIMRFLAREPRTRRRMLAERLVSLVCETPKNVKAARLIHPSRESDPYYVFLVLPSIHSKDQEEYREVRRLLLAEYCGVVKVIFPQAQDIVGIATDPGVNGRKSEDFIYLDASNWTEEEENYAANSRKELGIFNDVNGFMTKVVDYPQNTNSKDSMQKGEWKSMANYNRNWPCPCGSKRKFKRCCEWKFIPNNKNL